MQPYPPQQQQQPYPQQYRYAPPQPRVNPGVLLGVTAWRLLIVAFALIGALASLEAMDNPWPGLSLQASLFTAGVYGVLALWPLFTAGRSHEPPSSWLRGATTLLLMVVMIVYLTMMDGDLDETWSLFEHLLTPLIVLFDWAVVGKGAARVKWWHPLTWVLLPAAYLIFLIASEFDMYGGMFSPDNDEFAGTVLGVVGLTIVLGYVIYGIGKLHGAMANAAKAQSQQHPHWQQQPQQQWPQNQPQQGWQPQGHQPAPPQPTAYGPGSPPGRQP